jgi:dipeptidyl aminopeptidase/acylaminoacyl peptidase
MVSLRCCAALVCAVAGLAKSPITHEDVWLMKRVGAPVPSPDGKWVVFSVTEPAYDEKAQVSDLWIAPGDGSAKPRRLTATKAPENGVAWSRDSRRLAFSTRREGDEANQIYVLDLEGGEAQRLTSAANGATSPVWSPDAKSIAFVSPVYPGDPAARKNRKYRARVYDGFPIRYWDHWLDDSRPHLFIQELREGAKAKDLLTKLGTEPGFGGSETMTGEELSPAWAPDGASLVFIATNNRNVAAYAPVHTHLFQVSAQGGEPTDLTPGDDSYTRPVFRPDGRALFCLNRHENGKVYNLERLAMFAWPNPGERTLITASFDRSVTTFAPGNTTVYLLAEDAGLERLYAVPAGGGAVHEVGKLERGAFTNVAMAQSAPVLLADWESAVNPGEVVRIDAASGVFRPISSFNSERAAKIDWQPLRHFWFTSKRGKKIHSMIALPPNFDEAGKYPLLVLLHGGAANMWRDQFFTRWNYHLLAAPGYVVLLTNYTGSTGFGEKFAQEIQLDPFAGPANEINQAADEAIRMFRFINGSRQAAAGASYGGHLANWMEATTTRYKCLVSHAGLINLESQWGTSDSIYHREVQAGGPVWEQGKVWREQNPAHMAKNFRTPMLLSVGERDFRVPLNNTLENWSLLQRMRVPSRLIVFEDENHWISKGEDSRFFYQEVAAWLKKYL